jgi:hypothetical protein
MTLNNLLIFLVIFIILFLIIYNNSKNRSRVVFIHVGKTGGTTLVNTFYFRNIVHFYHKAKYHPHMKYIISIRNPLHRFVSAFNMWSTVINKDLPKERLTLFNYVIHQGSYDMRKQRGFFVSHEYDDLIRYFKNPNNLAESLTSSDPEKKQKAHELFFNDDGHIKKNISWYLDNGKFIENNHKNIIYVTKQETLDDDVKNLSKILNKNINNNVLKNRVNRQKDTYLSPLAIKNLTEFYKDNEYKTLHVLYKYGFIDKEYLDYCYTYENK